MAGCKTPEYAGTPFELDWTELAEGRYTTVQLFNRAEDPQYPIARGGGADAADALLDLWITLGAARLSDADEFIATAYAARTGRRLRRRRFVTSHGA
jgi:hypothetical protein